MSAGAATVSVDGQLSEDAVDEDTGDIDRCAFDSADGFPGAFDSRDAETLRIAAKRWEGDACAADAHDSISLDLDQIAFDLDKGHWVCPAEIDDDLGELFLDGKKIVVSIF